MKARVTLKYFATNYRTTHELKADITYLTIIDKKI